MRTTRDRQPYKGLSRATKDVIFIMSTFRVITQFDIRSHQRVYIAWNEKFKPCGFISWKHFKVRTRSDRQPYKGATRATKDIISIISTFRVITKFDIRLHHYTACVYIMNGKFKPCGFISWKNFKVRTTRDRQPYVGPTRATEDIIFIISTFRVILKFDIRLHHYTACVYIMNGKFKPCGFISWKSFKVRTTRNPQPYEGPKRATKDIFSIISSFRVITQFDIRFHHCI